MFLLVLQRYFFSARAWLAGSGQKISLQPTNKSFVNSIFFRGGRPRTPISFRRNVYCKQTSICPSKGRIGQRIWANFISNWTRLHVPVRIIATEITPSSWVSWLASVSLESWAFVSDHYLLIRNVKAILCFDSDFFASTFALVFPFFYASILALDAIWE